MIVQSFIRKTVVTHWKFTFGVVNLFQVSYDFLGSERVLCVDPLKEDTDLLHHTIIIMDILVEETDFSFSSRDKLTIILSSDSVQEKFSCLILKEYNSISQKLEFM